MDNQKKPHILIVDDEEDIRDMLSRHFRFQGYEVLTAENGVEALRLLSVHRIEVVVTDIMMPEMNGLELSRTLHKEYPMVHVIVITGYVTLQNLLAAMRYGVDTCIFKPLEDLTELENAVSLAVEQLRNWQKKLLLLQSMKS